MRRSPVAVLAFALTIPLASCGETSLRCHRLGSLCEAPVRYHLTPATSAIAAADLDGDGALDFVSASGREGAVSVRWSDTEQRTDWYPRGELGDVVAFATGPDTWAIALTLPALGELVTLRADANRGLEEVGRLNIGAQPRALAVVELNGDGLDDIVTLDSGDGSVSLARGIGNGDLAARRAVASASPIAR